jgi:hypothetical protein
LTFLFNIAQFLVVGIYEDVGSVKDFFGHTTGCTRGSAPFRSSRLRKNPLFSRSAKRIFSFGRQAFDVDAWDYSPGKELLRQLFLYAADHVTREFDFSVACEFYKSRFANQVEQAETGVNSSKIPKKGKCTM